MKIVLPQLKFFPPMTLFPPMAKPVFLVALIQVLLLPLSKVLALTS